MELQLVTHAVEFTTARSHFRPETREMEGHDTATRIAT